MDLSDPVVLGAFGTVIGSVVIVGFLAYKVKSLINRDRDAHKS